MKNNFYISLWVVVLCWCVPLLPTRLVGNGTLVMAADVVTFTLVNADTDTDILTMTPGMNLELTTLPTRNLNIRANTNPATVGSVVFALSGAQAHANTESFAPYALFSDFQGDYFAWVPPVGSYSLTATPYDAGGGAGPAGTPLTLAFTVTRAVDFVSSFTLVNAITDLDLMPITAGMTLDLATLPTPNVNIRANASVTAGSVVFTLAGPINRSQTENVAPFALFSDFQGNYFPWVPVAGSYTLTATPYAAADGNGTPGTPLTISFTLVGVPPLAVQLTAFTAEARNAAAVQLRWSTASEENNHEFEVQRSTDGKVFGVISRLAGHGSTATPQYYTYTDEQLPTQAKVLYYRLRQVDTDGTASYSPLRTVALRPQEPAFEVFAPALPDGFLYYVYSGPTTGTELVEVYTLLGQRRGQFPLGPMGTGAVPVAGLAAGAYVLRLVGPTGHQSRRFVLP